MVGQREGSSAGAAWGGLSEAGRQPQASHPPMLRGTNAEYSKAVGRRGPAPPAEVVDVNGAAAAVGHCKLGLGVPPLQQQQSTQMASAAQLAVQRSCPLPRQAQPATPRVSSEPLKQRHHNRRRRGALPLGPTRCSRAAMQVSPPPLPPNQRVKQARLAFEHHSMQPGTKGRRSMAIMSNEATSNTCGQRGCVWVGG